MDLGFHDLHVLITGASGGIGFSTCRLYLELGARVTAHYNSSKTSLEPLLEKYGPLQLHLAQANLSDEEATIQLFADLPFGSPIVLIVNHGRWPTADVPVAQMSLDQWRYTMDSNLTSSFLVVREYLRALPKASAELLESVSIVLIGSTAGKYGEAGHADYAVTKSAMMYGLTLSLKNEIVKIAPRGRVNCVAPGWVDTPMASETLKDPTVVYRALASTPLKKVATPEDIASQIAILSSSKVSAHVTGQVLMVEGGMEGRLLNLPADM